MLKHHDNSLKLARYLERHLGVTKTLHPLLPSHPNHALAVEQHSGLHSGMITFYVRGGEQAALKVRRKWANEVGIYWGIYFLLEID